MNRDGWLITIEGKTFLFPAIEGYGLVTLENGKIALITFSCPTGASPRRNRGSEVEDASIQLSLVEGRLSYQGQPVMLGLEVGE